MRRKEYKLVEKAVREAQYEIIKLKEEKKYQRKGSWNISRNVDQLLTMHVQLSLALNQN